MSKVPQEKDKEAVILPELRKRVQKAGQPPGTAMYTGDKKVTAPKITVMTYSSQDFHEVKGKTLDECLSPESETAMTWINIEGLSDTHLINQLAQRYNLHPLTVEDILNVGQRSKIEEFEGYCFITLRMLVWHAKTRVFSMEQLSLVFGKNFVLSFQESATPVFNNIQERMRTGGAHQRLREHGSDYLVYRLIDTVVDQYFVVLEGLGEQIEKVEELIVSTPTPQNSRTLYRLKRQMLMARKAIWPMREALSHLLHTEGELITKFTRIYLRDVYDHTVQAIDTLETFRDMLGSMFEMYLSSLSARMNEIMKVLMIIGTIFLPITFIASIFSMNFDYIPGAHWRWGYVTSVSAMALTGVLMLVYFQRKKWL